MSTDAYTQSLTAQELPLEAVRLEAISGPGKGASATLERGTLIAGSGDKADLVLADGAVSRQHASFELLHGAVRVRDLQSRNGLLFLGARVEAALLPIGTSVTLGRTVVRIAPLQVDQLSAHTELAGVVAQATATRRLLWRVERVAATDATAVIRGPTGAGKEVVARAIHQLSARAKAPLEFFDCASARGELLESDLFGHVRGAFTGATNDRVGVIELAHRGTLVLDNIDGLPIDLQARLLRFLEERTVRRVGGAGAKKVDVRVLATTQSVLEDAVAQGRLRSDIFFRLAEVVLEVPPLSQRLEDIPVLAAGFVAELATVPVTLSKATIAALQAHPWPGNARELKNAVARCLAFGRFESEATSGGATEPAQVDLKDARARVVHSFEADFLLALLRKHRWNVAAVAREAKIARSHLYTLIARYKLERE
jgi:DNA-binding NtrC family response regulator